MYIYIYMRSTMGLPIPNHMLLQLTLHSAGRINKSIQEYWNPTLVKLYIQLGRSTKVLGNIKIPTRLNSTFSWEDQQRY